MLFGGQRTTTKHSIYVCSNIVYSNVFQRMNVIDLTKVFQFKWRQFLKLYDHLKSLFECNDRISIDIAHGTQNDSLCRYACV